VERTLSATAQGGDRKAGVIWHTQGSGKSLLMAFYAGQRKFVWAVDDAQLEFVRRDIATAPDRTIITEEQKRQSLVAARGELVEEASSKNFTAPPDN
jgi:hypothetical protein